MARGSGKSGVAVAEEHFQALRAYLQANKGVPLPRTGAELNKSAIARACGFDRQVFRTNPRCAQLLAAADGADPKNGETAFSKAQEARETIAKSDREMLALEEQNVRLMVENAALRRELDRYRQLSAMIAQTGRLP